ncbi:aurora kinase A and ninein-interacting protein-like [Heteronotia binoei]|uniref:aurora kinase A and ninein-interacting protein-like n=1 Tax=Heteronotia binoei TaxID=13085 RepID=UPI00292EBF68|nr:aurora kinase A and ninein-interacting protein-like [Heteronotia binoei]XP_060114617.1 aurora kinase A and ninein-interacting protein-like [Heteronotia binoei]
MKRKGRSPAEQPQEACGIWLDTLALKKSKMQTLIAKPTLRMQSRPLPYPALEKVPLPFTKQTSISTFFCSQPVGEKKANANTELSGAASKGDCNLQGRGTLEGDRSQLAVSSFPPLQEFKRVQHHARWTCAQNNSGRLDQAKGEKCTTEDDNLDCTQHPEANGVIEHTAVSRSPLKDKNGGWRTSSTVYSQTSQNLKVLRRGRTCSSYSKSHLSDSSNSENTDPQLERSGAAMKLKGFNQNMIGIPSETVMAPCVSDKGPKDSQLGCTPSLFSQDSEGRRVISHRFSGERGNLCLLKQPLWDKSDRGTSPAYRDCLGACFPAESGPQLHPGAEISLNSCYDLLFTEDSEGNRVIKH